MKKLTYIFVSISILFSAVTFAQPALDYPLDTINGHIYYRYTVERGIGLYRISKNFHVTQEDILASNPELQQRGLHFDEVILIPVKGELLPTPTVVHTPIAEKKHPTTEEKPIVSIAAEMPEVSSSPQTKTHKVRTPRIFPRRRDKDSLLTQMVIDTIQTDTVDVPIRLAILLPLHADAIKRERNMERFYDFYSGVLIAINEVQATGQRIEAFVYDVGKTAQEVERVLSDSLFPEVDAIIGPAYNQQVKVAAQYALSDSTWMLVPFVSSTEETVSNPYILQFNPSEHTVADTLAQYLAQYGDSINCVLVESREGDIIPFGIAALRTALDQYSVPTTTTTIRNILIDSLETSFVPEVDNYVLFNTERYGNLQAVMPHLLEAYSQYRIVLFSQYSWQNEKIILPQIYTSIFSDSIAIPEEYTHTFIEYFNHELSSTRPHYDLLGYDLTRHLLFLLQNDALGSDTTELWHGIQSPILYQRVSNGGYENQMIHILRK